MPRLLMTARLARQCDRDLRAIAARTGATITPLILPDDDAPLPPAALAQVELAYASPDLYEVGVRRVWHFLDTLDGAPNLRWAHLGWAGTDNPRFGAMLARGVRLSNSPGAAAEPIAHSVMAGLLALARRLPYFAAQQRDHRWERLPLDRRPPRPQHPDPRRLRPGRDRGRGRAAGARLRSARDRRAAQPPRRAGRRR